MSTTVIRKACARFPGFVLLAVTPFRRIRRIRGIRRRALFFAYFSKNRPWPEKSLETLTPGYLADTFLDPEIFPVFSIFEPPPHRPHVELRRRGSTLRNPGFPFFTGGRAAGSGGRGPVSGIWGCWLRISASGIYIHLLPINRPCGRYVNQRLGLLVSVVVVIVVADRFR